MKIYVYDHLDERGRKKYQTIEISEAEAEQWVQLDFEKRQSKSDVPVMRRTAQEIMNDISAEFVSSDRKAFDHNVRFGRLSDDEGNEIDEIDLLSDNAPTSEEVCINKEMQQTVDDALTDVQRERFNKHVFQGMTFREIAEEEGTTHGAVEKSVNLAKKKLKKLFS